MEYSIEKMISETQIEERIKELAKMIESDYAGKELVCVGLLKGSIMFMADLLKRIELILSMFFM